MYNLKQKYGIKWKIWRSKCQAFSHQK
jgi:hypothetical protein